MLHIIPYKEHRKNKGKDANTDPEVRLLGYCKPQCDLFMIAFPPADCR